MANFKQVNRAIKKAFPSLNVEAVRGDGYVYFDGEDGWEIIEAIYIHPVSASTETMIRICLEAVSAEYGE